MKELSPPNLANFIIAGTEKAGTTSVFTYLSAHPSVCGSVVKETDFFRNSYTGNHQKDIDKYATFFERCTPISRIVMEASPGYLGSAEQVAIRIHELIPHTKLLFILRNPIDRLYSSFNFHIGKLNLDKNLSFEDYVSKCIAYDCGQKTPAELGIGEWYLKVISFGRYAHFLKYFYQQFPEHQIKVMFFENLNQDVAGFMYELCQFLEISPDPYKNYDFKKINVTYESKIKWLHKLAMFINARSEKVLRQRPKLKQHIVNLYKTINQEREGYDNIPPESYIRLAHYYEPSIDELRKLIGPHQLPWNLEIK